MPLQVATQGGERGELASGAGGRRGGSEVGSGGGVLVGTATCGVEAVAGEEGHCASNKPADGEETTRVLSSIESVLELKKSCLPVSHRHGHFTKRACAPAIGG